MCLLSVMAGMLRCCHADGGRREPGVVRLTKAYSSRAIRQADKEALGAQLTPITLERQGKGSA